MSSESDGTFRRTSESDSGSALDPEGASVLVLGELVLRNVIYKEMWETIPTELLQIILQETVERLSLSISPGKPLYSIITIPLV
jgi:hypothetical protein